MKKPLRFVPALSLLLFLVLSSLGGLAQGDGPRDRALADGVFAVLQPEELRFNDSNSLVVDLGDGLLVVDSQSSLAATKRTIEVIRARTDKPVRWLVLTHWHGDHVQGIPAYRSAWPGVAVVAHESVAGDIEERAAPALDEDIEAHRTGIAAAREKIAAGVGLDDEPLDEAGRVALAGRIERTEQALEERLSIPRPLATPNLDYSTELVIRGPSGRSVRLLSFRAHTGGDTIVHLPEDGILATGDVLDDLPFGGHGYPTSWVETLRTLEGLDFETIVPGHGAVRKGKDHLVLIREMTASLVDQVTASAEAGRDLETTLEALDLEAYRLRLVGGDERAGRAWNAFIPATAERAWHEATGTLDAESE